MSRLLMLALVLALTSASYATVATIEITVNGQDYTGQSVEPSDIIKVVWNTTTSIFGGYTNLDFNVSLGDYVADSFRQRVLTFGPHFYPVDTGAGMAIRGFGSGIPFPAGWTFEFEFHFNHSVGEDAA